MPNLLSYLQTKVDESDKPGQFIITGSGQFTLLEKLSHSLAGRVGILKLLPLTLPELSEANEIDCIIEQANKLKAIEIKSGLSISDDFFKHLTYWQELTNNTKDNCYLVYGGEKKQLRNRATVLGWNSFAEAIDII